MVFSTPPGEPPGGWIAFPGGNFQPDPASVTKRPPSYGGWGAGGGGISYDRAFGRWIPTDWEDLSPDGRRYVWDGLDGFHVVDVVSDSDVRVFAMPQIQGVWWGHFTESGVYLSTAGSESGGKPGLWVLDPDSGQIRQLDATQLWTQIDSTAAWGVTYTLSSTRAASGMSLSRLDLRNGTRTTQLTVPYHNPPQPGDLQLDLVALDRQGRPLVLLRDWQHPFPWRLAILEGPETLREVAVPSEWANWTTSDNRTLFQPQGDVHGYLLSSGIWMIGTYPFKGLALLGADGVVRQLTTEPNLFAIAGGCH